jgi:hypothetical protein
MEAAAAAVAGSSPADWAYLCEGGNSIVLRYAGAPHADLTGCVLRLHKEAAAAAEPPPPPPPPLLRELLPPDAPGFAARVLAPLLAALGGGAQRCLLPAAALRPAPAEAWLRALDARLCAPEALRQRPLHRAAAGLRLRCGGGALEGASVQRDGGHDGGAAAAGARALCIELKPKWGLPPRAPHLPCRFCLQQLAKAAAAAAAAGSGGGSGSGGSGEGGSSGGAAAAASAPRPALSHYCPLDLFSGSAPRVRRALHALVAAPQNNFRVFEGGALVYGQEALEAAGAAAAPLRALEAALGGGLPAEPLLQALAQALCAPPCPLPALLRLQGLSAAAGEEAGAARALAALEAGGGGGEGAAGAGEGEGGAEAALVRGLEALLAAPAAAAAAALPPRLALAAFLTSASAKDASLLVRVRVRRCGALEGQPAFALIDLDPKPPGRVAKYAAQARGLEEGWARGGAAAFAAAGKACSSSAAGGAC